MDAEMYCPGSPLGMKVQIFHKPLGGLLSDSPQKGRASSKVHPVPWDGLL